jgi:hypothetical protein
MRSAFLRSPAFGPERLLTTVGSPPPFALSLSKGQAELVFPIALSLSKGAFAPHAKGFDKLSPNGDEAGLRSLSPNGSLRTVNFAFGPQADACSMRRDSRQARWSH